MAAAGNGARGIEKHGAGVSGREGHTDDHSVSAGRGQRRLRALPGARLERGLRPGSIADNRGGAGTVIGTEIAAKGNPDGHTLLIVSVPFVVLNARTPDLKTDAVRDFAPVILAGSAPSIMLANAATPYKSVKDLVSAARAKPGEVAYASSGNGGSTHLMMELFKSLTKTSSSTYR